MKTPLDSSKRAKSAQSSPKPSKKDKKKEKKKEEGGTSQIVQASQVFKQLQSIIIIFYRGKIRSVELVSDLSLSHKNK